MNKKKIFLITFFLLGAIAISGLAFHLFNPYLWFDEAGQFYISKGLNHYSQPFSQPKGLAAVIDNNAHYNLDPGGFSVLLFFWSKITNHYLWLRLLSFLFYLGAIASSFFLFKKILTNANFAFCACFLFFLGFPFLFERILAVEIRAYSMEIAGTISGLLLLLLLSKKYSLNHLILTSFCFSFFITSRYSEIIVIFVYSIVVLFLIYKNNNLFYKKCLHAILYAVPLLACLAFVYFSAMSIQNPKADYIGYLDYLNNDIKKIFNWTLFCLIFLSIALVVDRKYHFLKESKYLIIITLSINLTFIALSVWGKHPWDTDGYRCVSAMLLTTMSCFTVVVQFCNRWEKSPHLFPFVFMILLASCAFFNLANLYHCRHEKNLYYEMVYHLDAKPQQKIVVSAWEATSVKYLFENTSFGKKLSPNYPDSFVFLAWGETLNTEKIDQYNYVILPCDKEKVNEEDLQLLHEKQYLNAENSCIFKKTTQ